MKWWQKKVKGWNVSFWYSNTPLYSKRSVDCGLDKLAGQVRELNNKKIDIMTPKEKAKELVDKSMIGIIFNIKQNIEASTIEASKKCALILVDEILNLLPLANRDYWQEVKQEIEKL